MLHGNVAAVMELGARSDEAATGHHMLSHYNDRIWTITDDVHVGPVYSAWFYALRWV
jgi:hypothetical protein